MARRVVASAGRTRAPTSDDLLRGDRRGAADRVLDAVRTGTPLRDIYLKVLQPVQHEVGRLWQLNGLSVAQEHFCTAATQLVMSMLYPYLFDGPRTDRVLVATCARGDLHRIGLRVRGPGHRARLRPRRRSDGGAGRDAGARRGRSDRASVRGARRRAGVAALPRRPRGRPAPAQGAKPRLAARCGERSGALRGDHARQQRARQRPTWALQAQPRAGAAQSREERSAGHGGPRSA